jgi:hypothetical protein
VTVERFSKDNLTAELNPEAAEIAGPVRFKTDDLVWAAQRPAVIVDYLDFGGCGGHPDDHRYSIRFASTRGEFLPWPYCESQLSERNYLAVGEVC